MSICLSLGELRSLKTCKHLVLSGFFPCFCLYPKKMTSHFPRSFAGARFWKKDLVMPNSSDLPSRHSINRWFFGFAFLVNLHLFCPFLSRFCFSGEILSCCPYSFGPRDYLFNLLLANSGGLWGIIYYFFKNIFFFLNIYLTNKP